MVRDCAVCDCLCCGVLCCECGACCCVAKNAAVTVLVCRLDLRRFEVSHVSVCKLGRSGRGLESI